MSKGSAPRPIDIDLSKFDENWDKVFGERPQDDKNQGLLICTFPDKNHRCEGCDCWKSKELSQ